MARSAAFFATPTRQPLVPLWVVIVAQVLPWGCAIVVYLLYHRGRLPWLHTLVHRDRDALARDHHFFAKLFLAAAVTLLLAFVGPVLNGNLPAAVLLLCLWPLIGVTIALATGDLRHR